MVLLWLFLCTVLWCTCCKNQAQHATPKVMLTMWIIGMAFPDCQRMMVRVWLTVCDSVLIEQAASSLLWDLVTPVENNYQLRSQHGTSNRSSTFHTCWTPANRAAFVLKTPLTRQRTEQRLKKIWFTVLHHHRNKTILYAQQRSLFTLKAWPHIITSNITILRGTQCLNDAFIYNF